MGQNHTRKLQTHTVNHGERVTKITTLGCGETGKSTLHLQFYFATNTTQEIKYKLESSKNIVPSFVLSCFNALIACVKRHALPLLPENYNILHWQTHHFYDTSMINNQEFVTQLLKLYKDPTTQLILTNPHKYESNTLTYNLQHLVSRLENFSRQDYMPTQIDIMLSKVRTCGITEYAFIYNQKSYSIRDVGGLQNERKKWIYLLQDTDLFLYCFSLTSFYMTLYEDSKTNRLQEEINVFVELWKYKAFRNVIIVFTHGDILQQQLQLMTIYEIQSFPCMKGFFTKSEVTVKLIAEYIIDKIVESVGEKVPYLYNDIFQEPRWIVDKIMKYYRYENDSQEVWWNVPMKINYTIHRVDTFSDISVVLRKDL